MCRFLDEINYSIDDVYDLKDDYEKFKKVFTDLRIELEEKHKKYLEDKKDNNYEKENLDQKTEESTDEDKKNWPLKIPKDIETVMGNKKKINKDKEKEEYDKDKHYESMVFFLGYLNYLIEQKYDLGEDYVKYKKVFSDLRKDIDQKYNQQKKIEKIDNISEQIPSNLNLNNDANNINNYSCFSYCVSLICCDNRCERCDSFQFKELFSVFIFFLIKYVFYIIILTLYDEFSEKQEELPLFFNLCISCSGSFCFFAGMLIYRKKFPNCLMKIKGFNFLSISLLKMMTYFGLYFAIREILNNDNSIYVLIGSLCFQIINLATILIHMYRLSREINFLKTFLYGIMYIGIISLIFIALGLLEFKIQLIICSTQLVFLYLAVFLCGNILKEDDIVFNIIIMEYFEITIPLGIYSVVNYWILRTILFAFQLLACCFTCDTSYIINKN